MKTLTFDAGCSVLDVFGKRWIFSEAVSSGALSTATACRGFPKSEGNAAVNAADVSLTKSQVGQAVMSSNFREDVNANGLISAGDVALVKSDVGTALPP